MHMDFRVRRAKVLGYNLITLFIINFTNLNILPEDGIPDQLLSIQDCENEPATESNDPEQLNRVQ